MIWPTLGLIALGYIVPTTRWALKGVFDDDCERVNTGHNCKGKQCPCNNKESSYGNPNKEK